MHCWALLTKLMMLQGGQLEIVAASVVHLTKVAVDRATPRQAWDNVSALRHFSVVQQLEGQPWPQGAWWREPAADQQHLDAHTGLPAVRLHGQAACEYAAEHLGLPAGFAEAVRGANASPAGKRNGGAVLSMQGSERALLQHLVARLHALGPDVLVGHNIAAADLSLLLQRMQHHKVRLRPCSGLRGALLRCS